MNIKDFKLTHTEMKPGWIIRTLHIAYQSGEYTVYVSLPKNNDIFTRAYGFDGGTKPPKNIVFTQSLTFLPAKENEI